MAFPIVAIAASAGGLEAVSELLGALPAKSDMAFIVVQHLAAAQESLLPELLGKRTKLQVVTVSDGIEVKPDCVYVISPNTTLTIQNDRLKVEVRGPEVPHHPADILFNSLAEARAETAIGIVLSGAMLTGRSACDPSSIRAESPLPKNLPQRGFRACQKMPSTLAAWILC